MNREIKINYPVVAEAQQQLSNLAGAISEEFVVNIPNSQGSFVDELRRITEELNVFRSTLVDVITKTAAALDNTIVAFKVADGIMTFRG